MKIQQKTLSAGPNGVVQPGEVREVSDQVGRELISSGAAVAFHSVPVKEVAAVEPEVEIAAEVEQPIRRRTRNRG